MAATASFASIASGDLCKIDGTTIEVFCKETKQTVLVKLKDDPTFKSELDLVRNGVMGAEVVALARRAFLLTTNTCGMRVKRLMASVHRDEFTKHGCGELGSPACSAELVTMPSYEHGVYTMSEGTVMELKELP